MAHDEKSHVVTQMREDARNIFSAALAAVEPRTAIKDKCRVTGSLFKTGKHTLDLDRIDRLFVVGAGKAAAVMATAMEELLADRITDGVVVTKYAHGARLNRVRLMEAGHPIPDKNGEKGAQAVLNLVRDAKENDLVLCLISGGGSALLPLPVPALNLAQKQATVKTLLACGADIHEINAIRKHISAIKGGRLARAAYPGRVISLILSDVVGDDLDVIASGPCVPDSTTFADCLEIVQKYDIIPKLPLAVIDYLKSGATGDAPETPKKGDRIFQNCRNLIIADNLKAILAARKIAQDLGYQPLILSSMIQGDTRQSAKMHAAVIQEVFKSGNPLPLPACILSGGETTVTLSGDGLGGRNQEFALAIASEISGLENVVVLSGGTDGTDGPTDAAGALVDHNTLKQAQKMGLDYRAYLKNNDSYHFFEKTGDLLMTGPTYTNVMDLRIILMASP